jgi:uncharacterized protein
LSANDPTRLAVAASWRHVRARDGFEVLFVRGSEHGVRCEGEVAAVEDGVAWAVSYDLLLDSEWRTRSAHVACLTPTGRAAFLLEGDGHGRWRVDGEPAPRLDGCSDVDLEASVFTNALPIRRLQLAVGESADAPAAYVRVPELRVERLEQRYQRLPDDGPHTRYDYRAPAFRYAAVLAYDESGLVVEYPGLAVRVS